MPRRGGRRCGSAAPPAGHVGAPRALRISGQAVTKKRATEGSLVLVAGGSASPGYALPGRRHSVGLFQNAVEIQSFMREVGAVVLRLHNCRRGTVGLNQGGSIVCHGKGTS
ncbi:MAG: hypothetical protein ND807_03595 [Vicinamibacterales bacterium]|nr:hypothetical protein [Vicinamibacterales bacterium]